MAKKMLLVDPKVMEQLKQTTPPPPPPPQIPARPMPDVLSDTLIHLDREMQGVLKRNDLPAHDKALLYQQILHRYLSLGEQYEQQQTGIRRRQSSPDRSAVTAATAAAAAAAADAPGGPAAVTTEAGGQTPATESVSSTAAWEEQVLNVIPRSFRSKAKNLLKHIRNVKDLAWTPTGEMVYRGRVVPESHIVDLVGDMMRERKTAEDPAGWEMFATALKHSNVPKDFIGHEGRKRWMQQQQQPQQSLPPPQQQQQQLQRQRVPEEEEEEEEVSTPRGWRSRSRSRRRRRRRLSEITGAEADDREEEEEEEEEEDTNLTSPRTSLLQRIWAKSPTDWLPFRT